MSHTSDTKKDLTLRRAECSQCGGTRNCDIKGQFEERLEDEHFSFWRTWYLLQCKGCDYVFLQTCSTDSESYTDHYGRDGEAYSEYLERFEYWPAISSRKKPDWFDGYLLEEVENSEALGSSLRELYGALDADLNTLATVGIRMTFDIASSLLDVKENLTFNEKLNDLVDKGHIGVVDKNRLKNLIDAGNASAHRGWAPKTLDLKIIMDVLEHFLENALVAPAKKAKLDANMLEISKGIPARTKVAKSEKNAKKNEN